MRLHEAGAAISHQEGLERAVAAHCGQIVGEQEGQARVMNHTVKGDKHRGSGHEARAYRAAP